MADNKENPGKVKSFVNPGTFKDKFYSYLKHFSSVFILHIQEEIKLNESYLERLKFLIEYNCHGGKHNRAFCLASMSEKIFQSRGVEFDSSSERKTFALACCVEILQASLLVADDISDNSKLRRGKPCWYRRADVRMAAVNDSYILLSFLRFILREEFSKDKIYTRLINIFNEVELKTQIGQMIDLDFSEEHEDIEKLEQQFSKKNFEMIVTHKTAFYTYYLPISCAFLLNGQESEGIFSVVKKISLMLGKKFQIQDDFMDCFCSPEKIGKVGTDIEENKCSWLVVTALERCNNDQKQIILNHYGIDKKESCKKVKELYEELGLRKLFKKEEEESYESIKNCLKSFQKEFEDEKIMSADLFLPLLEQIQMRRN